MQLSNSTEALRNINREKIEDIESFCLENRDLIQEIQSYIPDFGIDPVISAIEVASSNSKDLMSNVNSYSKEDLERIKNELDCVLGIVRCYNRSLCNKVGNIELKNNIAKAILELYRIYIRVKI